MTAWGVWGVGRGLPLEPGSSIRLDGQATQVPTETQLSRLAPGPLPSHPLVTASAGGQNVREGLVLVTSWTLGEEIGATKD